MTQYSFPFTFRDLDEAIAYRLADEMKPIVQGVADAGLDLSGLRQIVIAIDYDAALAEVDRGFEPSDRSGRTNEEYAVGVAMAVPVMVEGIPGSVLVLNANILSGLLSEDEAAKALVTQLLVHELAHVHDEQIKSQALADVWLKKQLNALDGFLNGAADRAWSEYYACRVSALVAPEAASVRLETFREALGRTRPLLVEETLKYRRHGDFSVLWGLANRHGSFLLNSAAYVLGDLHGLGKSLEETDPETAKLVEGSHFAGTWRAMEAALRSMWDEYPAWSGFEVYEPLMRITHEFWESLGFVPSLDDKRRLYVEVPFTPETTPAPTPQELLQGLDRLRLSGLGLRSRGT